MTASNRPSDGAGDPVDVAELVRRLGRDGSGDRLVEERAGAWWRERDPRAGLLLDAIAKRARTEQPVLDVLLRVVATHGVARPPIRRYLLDEHDVADVEQSTLAVVALRLDGWEGRSRFTTWLHQVAANEAKMFIRARDRRPATRRADPPDASFSARLSTLVADRDVVERAMHGLPDDVRLPLVLREIDGFDHAEIAGRLGIPVGTVRSRLHRARAMLVVELRALLDAD